MTGALGCSQFLSALGTLGTARAPRQTRLPVPWELLNRHQHAADRQTGLPRCVHSGSLLPPAAHGYTPASSFAQFVFSSCQFPEETHQEQREALVQSGNSLPSCLHRRTVPRQRHVGHRSKCEKAEASLPCSILLVKGGIILCIVSISNKVLTNRLFEL